MVCACGFIWFPLNFCCAQLVGWLPAEEAVVWQPLSCCLYFWQVFVMVCKFQRPLHVVFHYAPFFCAICVHDGV